MEKVFEFNNEGEKDWIAADTIDQAKEFFSDIAGDPNVCKSWDIKELTEDDKCNMLVIDYSDHYSDEQGEPKNDGKEFIDGNLVLGTMKALAECSLEPELIASNYE